MSERKSIINTNLNLFLREFQEHVQLGWEIDDQNPSNILGVAYETGLLRTDKSVAALVTRDVNAPPAKTRAEILTHARSVRDERRAERAREAANGN